MPKKERGRPPIHETEPIPDTLENVAKAVLKTRTKAERDKINRRRAD